jgi:hypothetical protein
MICNTINVIQVVIRTIHFTVEGSLIQMALTSTHIVTVFVLSVFWEVVIHRRIFYRRSSSILLLLRKMMILVTMELTVPGIVFSYVVNIVIIFIKALASSSAGAD